MASESGLRAHPLPAEHSVVSNGLDKRTKHLHTQRTSKRRYRRAYRKGYCKLTIACCAVGTAAAERCVVGRGEVGSVVVDKWAAIGAVGRGKVGSVLVHRGVAKGAVGRRGVGGVVDRWATLCGVTRRGGVVGRWAGLRAVAGIREVRVRALGRSLVGRVKARDHHPIFLRTCQLAERLRLKPA